MAIVALAASLPGLANGFVQDDFRLIQENARVHGLSHWSEILTSPYWPPPWHQELYRPATTLFHALQFTVGGGDPLLFRLVSYLLYAATAIVVLSLARRLLPAAVALSMALLFAAHPVHVEAVALAVGQSELLVALLTVGMTLYYLDRRRRGSLRPGEWIALAAVYAFAGMVKEQGLLLPAFLLAIELSLPTAPLENRLRRLAPGYAGLALVAIATVLLRRLVLGGQFAGVFVAEALQGLSLPQRALTMLRIVPEWGRLLFWPAHLQADYAPRELMASTGLGGMEAFGLLILLAAGAAALIARRRAPAVTFGIIWMALSLFPVSNLLVPTGFLLAERTLFLPSVGVVIALGGGIAWITAREGGLESRPWRWQRELMAVVTVLVVAGVLRSMERHRVWRNEAFFSVRSVQDAPRSYRAQRDYAEVLFALDQRELALEAYARAVALAPPGNAWRVHNDLARRYRTLGETAHEVGELRASLAEQPGQEDTRGHLISALLLLGLYPDAIREIDLAAARAARPEVFRSLRSLADSAARVGAPPGSVRIRVVPEPTG